VFRNLYPDELSRAQQDPMALHARLMLVDGISNYLIKQWFVPNRKFTGGCSWSSPRHKILAHRQFW
jgi:hypothetical protein